MSLNLKSLVGKLTDASRRGLEGAAGLALSRTHYDVDIEHWLAKLMEPADADIPRILRRYDIDPDRFLRGLERSLDRYKTGNGGRPQLAPGIEDMLREAWVLASVNYGASRVRSGALLLAALTERSLRRQLLEAVPEAKSISVEGLEQEFTKIVAGAPEDRDVFHAEPGALPGAGARAGGAASTPALDQFTVDLTATARAGKVDPVLGRDPEIRQIIDILTRRRQNNPILTGEAGVGKTAVVEGFALRIAAGDVPAPLRNVTLRTLDLGLLQAGAGVKGEFENRLKEVIEEVKGSPVPIILFIDEAHTLIGAGGAEGQNDAANLLKPALARGELRTVAATTWAEYKKYFEKDPALSRRFQVIKVEEPDEAAAVEMMRGLTGKLEAHHRVRILDEAVVDSVRLSHRYIPARQLPDKCVSVLDTACARVAMGRQATPAAVEDTRRRIDGLDTEIAILKREAALGQDHAGRLAALGERKAKAEAELAALEERWQKELALVDEILDLRIQLERGLGVGLPGEEPAGGAKAAGGSTGGGETAGGGEAAGGEAAGGEAAAAAPLDEKAAKKIRKELAAKKQALAVLQGEIPLVGYEVDGQAIAEVISGWTGIPVGRM
ncbi:MAG: AAA family ATPase, partial [Candidatus Krumholzibacteriota bacterium]|nr:AAA family ATPase [Candidatus Krumholzibacteriota bacterium]